MERSSTLFLKAAIMAIGVAVLAVCLFALPAAWMAIPTEFPEMPYVFYGILTAMYISAVPFFIGLHQGLRLLDLVDKNQAFSMQAVHAIKIIASCAIAVSAVYTLATPLFYIWAKFEDAPGLVIIGMFLAFAPLVVGVFAAVLRRLFQQAVVIKSENDLTV